jgi:DNA-binding transcriptional ArsR family regulator
VQEVLQAVSNPHRRAILRLVWDAELTSGEINAQVPLSWPAVSQNLKLLREAGLVHERRDGTRRLYQADKATLGAFETVLCQMWEADLARLADVAEAEERHQRQR